MSQGCTSQTFKAAIGTSLSSSFLLLGYAFFRSTAETLFRNTYGPENLPLITALSLVPLALCVYAYNKLIKKVSPQAAFRISVCITAMILLLGYLGLQADINWLTGVLYIFKDIYIVLIIEQYWSFLNSIFTEHDAKKFNGMVLAISTLGAILGGVLLWHLSQRWGTLNMLIVPLIALVPTLGLMELVFSKVSLNTITANHKTKKHRIIEDHAPLSPQEKTTLWALALLVVFSQLYSTIASFHFQTMLTYTYPSNMDQQNAYSGLVHSLINTLALVMQLVLAPVVLRGLSLKIIHGMIPILHLILAACMLIFPNLLTASILYVSFKSIDYSLFKAAKEILYIPLTLKSKYYYKQWIDSMFYRGTKGLSSLALVSAQSLGLRITAFYPVGLLLFAGAWILSIIWAFKKTGTSDKMNL